MLTDDTLNLLNRLENGQAFFFAGSGISYMSNMPSASKVLFKTADIFLPQYDIYNFARIKLITDENNYHIQPEIFYETLLYVLNTNDVLTLWKSLSPDYLKSFDFPVIPNINHLFIVDYSVKNKIPIFTTNFDCLFEEAAKELGYDYEVLLPQTDTEEETIRLFQNGSVKPNVAYIFKLHGSVNFNGTESLETLCTTMISITKINYAVIDFLEKMCERMHVIFVGYSGRDIDYFPELRKRSLSNPPFWIDRFYDQKTKENSEYIGAIPISFYPNEIFEKKRPDLYRNIPPTDIDAVESVFDNLQKELAKKIVLEEDDRRLLLGLLIREIGDYRLSYGLLLGLYRNNCFSDEKRVILLLALSSLAHENSLYESCGFFAKEALKITKKKSYLVSFTIRALFQISESKRMLIAHVVGFLPNIDYLGAFMSLLSFLINTMLAKRNIRKIEDQKFRKVSDIFVIHDFIEHRIRLLSLAQALIKPIIEEKGSFLTRFFRRWLIKSWEKINHDSFFQGYSGGIAAVFKYKTRIVWDIADYREGTHIYELKTYETGKGLSLSNVAENYFKKWIYKDSKECYREAYKIGKECGNKLNAIKGLLGIARCNRVQSIFPLLEPNELEELKKLMRGVEGKNWQRYFSKVLKQIE